MNLFIRNGLSENKVIDLYQKLRKWRQQCNETIIMKTFNSLLFIVVSVAAMKLFTSCTGNASFSPEEMRFAKPFVRADTVIYRSDAGQTDTILFQAARIDTISYRNLEQGFYNENMLRVAYALSPKSFHQFTGASTDGTPTYLI